MKLLSSVIISGIVIEAHAEPLQVRVAQVVIGKPYRKTIAVMKWAQAMHVARAGGRWGDGVVPAPGGDVAVRVALTRDDTLAVSTPDRVYLFNVAGQDGEFDFSACLDRAGLEVSDAEAWQEKEGNR